LLMRYFLSIIVGGATCLNLGIATVTAARTNPEISTIHLAQQPNCNDPQTQTAMNICAGLSYQQVDRKLNQVYRQLLPTLAASRRQKLITSQQIWIRFRDTSCAFERSQFEGGTIASMIYSNCLSELTQQRTKQLEGYLEEGR